MKFAIAGAGYIAAIHARAIKNNTGEITAVVEKFADKEIFRREILHQIKQYTNLDVRFSDEALYALHRDRHSRWLAKIIVVE